MSDAMLPLRAAIQAHLAGHAGLTTAIGADRVFDEAPRAASGVYVVHGEVEAQDWSTGSDAGCEQDLGLVVWAGQSSSARQALEAAAIIADALHDAELELEGHRLINLRWRSSRLARDARTGLSLVTIRLRAVTEAI
jgi:hypothetical protein